MYSPPIHTRTQLEKAKQDSDSRAAQVAAKESNVKNLTAKNETLLVKLTKCESQVRARWFEQWKNSFRLRSSFSWTFTIG